MSNLTHNKNKIYSILLDIWTKSLKTIDIESQDTFISLGGNSLTAIQIIHKINESLEISLPLDAIFKHNTVEKLTTFIAKHAIQKYNLETIEKKIWQDCGTPLTQSQQQIYFLEQYNDNASSAYLVSFAFEINGKLDRLVLEKSINTILQRHDIFGSFFREYTEGIKQFIQKDINIRVPIEENINIEDLQKQILSETRKKINLSNPHLKRIKLLKLSEQRYFLVITVHHIITDAWSISLFKKELEECYNAFSNNEYPKLTVLKMGYADFISQQISYLKSHKIFDDSKYWQSNLVNFTEITFPTDFKRPKTKKFIGKRLTFSLNKTIVKKINRFNIQNNTTSFMLMATVLSILLSRYNQQEDVVIGFPISGRNASEFSHTMGLFLNTLVLRSNLQEKDTFESFLLNVKQNLLDAYAHQNFPFSQLVKQLNVSRSQNKNPIFQIMLVWQDSLDSNNLVFPEMTMTPHFLDNRTSKFDMTFEFIPSTLGIDCIIEYDTQLYKKSTIKRLSLHFLNLLLSGIENPNKNLLALEFITLQEKKRFLKSPILSKLDIVEPDTIHELFEKQAERFPDKMAICCDELALTYSELDKKSNQLARYIKYHYKECFTSPNILIGICLDRSLELVISMLAILKVGAAYVPLDPEWPKKRLDTVLSDANCSIVLTDNINKDKFSSIKLDTQKLLILDEELHELAEVSTLKITKESNKCQDLIYVIYTSGTTGVPKGVSQTHYNVIRLLQRGHELFGFTFEDVWTLFHSYTFDFSVWEIWGALGSGGCLVIPTYQETRDPVLFYHLVLQHKVTILNQTPSAFQLFMQAEETNTRKISALKYIIFGGEALDVTLLSPWWKRYSEKHPILVNMYGITETTVHTTYKFLTKKDLNRREFSNIGMPLADIKAYVVDSHCKLVPVGVPGELLLSGFGLSPGYLNRPQLNAEKFIKNKFNETLLLSHSLAESAFSRLYKTGDLVRRLADGSLEYLGRIDKQLKVKGFRIEAGEIEAALNMHKTIRQCLVSTLKQNNLTFLVAYYIADKRITKKTDNKYLSIELRTYLSSLLPAYAIPKFFIKLDSFPLTPNMKIDYAALPLPSPSSVDSDSPTTLITKKSRHTEPEAILAGLWKSTLQVDTIHLDDNFFSLGGDSISSIRIVTEARKKGFGFSVSDLFKSPTIRKLSKHYKNQTQAKKIKLKTFDITNKKQIISEKFHIAIENIEDIYPLSALQTGMVYHSSYSTKSAIYLDIFCYKIMGSYNKSCLLQAIQCLINLHPILRTSYLLNEFDEPIQVVHATIKIPFCEQHLANMSSVEQECKLESWILEEKTKSFRFEDAPLFRITAHLIHEKQFVLSISFHHSILDGWSLASFITELLANYSQQLSLKFRTEPTAKTKSVKHTEQLGMSANQLDNKVDWNFKEFVRLEKETLASEVHRIFWKNELRNFEITEIAYIENTILPNNNDFCSHCIQVNRQVTAKLIVLAKSLNISLDEIILTAHMKLLSIYSSQEDVLSGVVFNGRPSLDNIDTTLGLFLNTLPFRINVSNCTWKELIHLVSEKKKHLYPYRRYPLMKIMQDINTDPLFNIIFYFTHFHIYKKIKANSHFKIIDQKHYERTNFPLAINCTLDPVNKKLEIVFNYETQHYNSQQIIHLADSYIRLLESIVTDVDGQHTAFALLTSEQKRHLLIDWNQTEKVFPQNKLVHELIEDVTEKFPKRIAIIFETTSISYYELNRKSNQLANYLNKQKTYSNKLVGLCIDRSLEAIIAMLAVWKAGKAYIPIDPSYPEERIKFILNDSQCHILITRKNLIPGLAFSNEIDLIYLDDLYSITKSISAENSINTTSDKANLAYVIYTSGSTGMPKGVMVEHLSLVNLLWDMQKKIDFTENDNFLSLTSFSFDISILEIFLPLITGGCCVLADQSGSKDPEWIKDTLKNWPITVVQATASKWALLFEHGLTESKCKIKALCGGETLPTYIASQLIEFSESAWNVYGPTETTIWSTIYKLTKENIKLTKLPIGTPLSNTKVYVLDKNLRLMPIGGIGDLYISGLGLARGYLNQANLTKEKFIENPFISKNINYCRLYRTGDLARWLPDGNLDYINRSDYQIKIRGYRVEPGEVEHALLKHNSIKNSVVLLKENKGMHSLIAFLVKKKEENVSIKQLREFLSKQLPYYCIPDQYMFLEKLPTTHNEKIDYRQLMNIEIEPPQPVDDAVMTSKQLKFANLWKEVLQVKSISLSDNFFELGGNSLLTLRLVSKINKEFSIVLEMKEIIEHPVFSTLYDRIILLKDFQEKNSKTEETIDFVKSIPDPIIKLNETGNKTPLFLIHPVGGNVFYYIPLVKSLAKDRTVYAIQDPGIRCRQPLFESLNEMASFYIKVIKKYQPKGPYLLAGSSFGANATIEIARQLVNQGEQPMFVGLIDGWAKYPKEANDNREWFCQNLINQLKTLDQYFSRADIPELLLDLHWHRQQLLVKHILPDMSDMQLTLFKAKQTMDVLKPLESPYNNWDIYCKSTPIVYPVSGDHFTMHFPPNHESLAQAFKQCLEKINV